MKNNVAVPIRIGVIGAGAMGQNHLRVCGLLKEVELVGVVDVKENLVKSSAEKHGCVGYHNIQDLVGKVDAVIIAVPTVSHAKIGKFFLENGIHCLIEKPLVATEEECLELIHISQKRGVILSVGHIEYFNSAVQALYQLSQNNEFQIQAIDSQRMNYCHRISDVDVVMDLMIHDLQIINSLIKDKVIEISANALALNNSNQSDYVSALLTFKNGSIANLTASRITQEKTRQLSITTNIGSFTLNYLTKELLFYPINESSEQFVERIETSNEESLILEIQNFVQSIRSGMVLGVDAKEALEALKLAWQIQDVIRMKSQINVESKEAVAV